jgi:hypothetical protein
MDWIAFVFFSSPLQYDVTSCGGALFIFSMVMFTSGLVMAFVLPYHYVSATNSSIHHNQLGFASMETQRCIK